MNFLQCVVPVAELDVVQVRTIDIDYKYRHVTCILLIVYNETVYVF